MVNLAVVGYGYWGPNLVRNFNEISDCKLVYVCDLNDEKLRLVKAKYSHIRATKNYKEVVQDQEIDGVVLSTPVSTHFSLAKEALRNGKHVLVEKPLCTTVKDAEFLVNLVEQKKKILMVSHTFLYSPPVIKIKELISRKIVGKIYYIDSSRVNLGLFQPDVSVLWDLGPHDISIILYWLEQMPIEVACQGKSYVRKEIEEVAFITTYFPDGTAVHIHISWLAPCKLRRTVIVGSKRMIVYDDTEPVEKVKIYNQGVAKNPESFGEFQLTYRSGDIVSPHLEAVEPLKMECLDFIRAIETGEKTKSDGQNGLRIVKVLEAAEKSLKNKGALIKIK